MFDIFLTGISREVVGGGGSIRKNPSHRGVWIIFGTTHYSLMKKIYTPCTVKHNERLKVALLDFLGLIPPKFEH